MKNADNVGKKLSLKTKIIYGTGDFYGGAAATIISMLFLFFLTDVVGMRPLYAGLVVFIGRIVDAVTDPLMGCISDRTESPWGRRNPYFLYFSIPVGIGFGLLWVKVPFQSELLIFSYYSVAYILFSLVFTAVMVPYAALAPELTQNYNERTSLISTRMAFSIIGALIAAVVPKTIIDMADSQSKGFLLVALIFGLIFIFIWLFMFLHMKDKEIYKTKGSSKPFFKALFSTLRNRSFVSLIGIYLFAFIVNDILSVNFIYYLTYYLEKPGIYTTIMGSLLICAALSLIVYVKLTKKWGKRKTFIAGAVYWSVILIFLMVFNKNTPSILIIIYAMFLGLGTGVSYAIPWSMLPDVIDLDEVISRERREGLYSGVMTFLRKLSSSLAILGISFVLELSGYVSTGEGVSAIQPGSAVMAIRLTTSIAPVLCLLVAIYAASRFPIGKENFSYIQSYLDLRKNGKIDNIPKEEHKIMIAELENMTGQKLPD